ncbi:MAG: GtrA family protein [Actinomycetota bacterium]
MTATLDANVSLYATAVEYVRENGAKLFKFLVVTGGSVALGQAIFATLLYGFDWPYVQANITSVAIMVMPNYLMNRYWVWGKKSKNNFKTEVLPFWTLAFIGFLFSTIAVWFVEDQGWPKLAALVANFVAYGVVWVFKFFVMERFLFGDEAPAEDAPALEPVAG